MKKLSYLLLPLVALLLTGCQPKYENVAVTFANLLAKGELEKASAYVTEDSKIYLDSEKAPIAVAFMMIVARTNENYQAKVKSSEVNGDTATVILVDANNPNSQEETFELVKENGKWLVNFDLEEDQDDDTSIKEIKEEGGELVDEQSEDAEELSEKLKEGAEEVADKLNK